MWPAGVLPSTVRDVSGRIFRLRLLAKFLGLVTFRGLHSETDIPEQVLTSSIQMRNRVSAAPSKPPPATAALSDKHTAVAQLPGRFG